MLGWKDADVSKSTKKADEFMQSRKGRDRSFLGQKEKIGQWLVRNE